MTTSDYDHRFHAGNHGDVFKHVALLALLAAFKRERVTVVDTHGGRGSYQLGPTGEWTAGVGRLLAAFPEGTSSPSGAVDRYLSRVRRLTGGTRTYPGSPRLLLDALGRNDRLRVHELAPDAAAAVTGELGHDPRARVEVGDGWAAAARLPTDGAVVLHVDPPFVEKEEWARAAEALTAARVARADVAALLWYPVKSLGRPNALHAALREGEVPYVAVELHVTPLQRENRSLVGSGVVLLGAPASVLAELHAALPVLGAALSPHGRWQARTVAG